MLSSDQKREIINKAKNFFKDEISTPHIMNTQKLGNLSEFNVNPFLHSYLANFFTGNDSAESLAKVLVYPRVLATSINTSFGQRMQKFCSSVLDGFGSVVTGIDIEFVDQIDGRKKYCQIKSGPNTINKDDIKTIIDHFQGIKNLARTNQLEIGLNDLIVGVLYGTQDTLNAHYVKIQEEHPVHVGQDFWHRLTGHENFYFELIAAFSEIAKEADGVELMGYIIASLAEELAKIDIV